MKNLDITCVNIELTTRCTARCPFCTRVKMNMKEIIDLKLETIKKIPFETYEIAVLSGSLGEPTVYPQFIDLLDHLHETNNNLQIRLTTNGFTHDEQWWYDLAKHFSTPEMGYAIFALDGLEDTHSLYRVGTDFKQVVKNIKAFNDGGGMSLIQTILFKHNEHQLDDLKKLSIELGCRKIFYRPSKEYNDVFERPIKIKIKTQSDFACERENEKINCFMIDRNEFFLNVDGILCSCYLLSSKIHHYKDENEEFIALFEKNIPLLNLNNHPYNDVLENEFYDYVFENMNSLVTCSNVCKCKLSELINFI